MKLSQVTQDVVCQYLRLPDGCDPYLMEGIMDSARSYILAHTGLTPEQADEHDDLVMAYLLLCQDMYDNRSAAQDEKSVNRTLDTILGLHTRNLV